MREHRRSAGFPPPEIGGLARCWGLLGHGPIVAPAVTGGTISLECQGFRRWPGRGRSSQTRPFAEGNRLPSVDFSPLHVMQLRRARQALSRAALRAGTYSGLGRCSCIAGWTPILPYPPDPSSTRLKPRRIVRGFFLLRCRPLLSITHPRGVAVAPRRSAPTRRGFYLSLRQTLAKVLRDISVAAHQSCRQRHILEPLAGLWRWPTDAHAKKPHAQRAA